MLPQVVFVIPGTPEELGAMVKRDMVAARPGGEGFRREGAGLAETSCRSNTRRAASSAC